MQSWLDLDDFAVIHATATLPFWQTSRRARTISLPFCQVGGPRAQLRLPHGRTNVSGSTPSASATRVM